MHLLQESTSNILFPSCLLDQYFFLSIPITMIVLNLSLIILLSVLNVRANNVKCIIVCCSTLEA